MNNNNNNFLNFFFHLAVCSQHNNYLCVLLILTFSSFFSLYVAYQSLSFLSHRTLSTSTANTPHKSYIKQIIEFGNIRISASRTTYHFIVWLVTLFINTMLWSQTTTSSFDNQFKGDIISGDSTMLCSYWSRQVYHLLFSLSRFRQFYFRKNASFAIYLFWFLLFNCIKVK